jgi:hypothetical protein
VCTYRKDEFKKKTPKQIVTARREGVKNRGRPPKRWTDVFEDGLKMMRIRNWHAVARNWMVWKRIVLETKVHIGLSCLRRR